MTKDDRTALYGIVQQFTPHLTHDVDHAQLDDDRTLTLVGEALAVQDAEITELRGELQALKESARLPNDSEPQDVPDEQVATLLRYHRVYYNDVHPEVYQDDRGKDRVRHKVVPRPAQVGDVLGRRDTGEAICVVLKDGHRHVLAYAQAEVA